MNTNMNGNQYKDFLLGMPHGTANNRLRKSILFSLLVELGYNYCFKCGAEIELEEDLSIEHKEPWQSAENPKESFFSLENIAFSHLKCNVSRTKIRSRIESPDGYSWCAACKEHRPLERFPKGNRWNGLAKRCQDCTNKQKRERRLLSQA